MTKQIHHTVFFPHDPEIVWDYLTKPALLSQWLMDNDIVPVVGCNFQFKTRPLPNFNFDGNIYCKILEVVPFKKLSYSWKGGPGNGEITLDSVVVWNLYAKDGGTELHLEHGIFREIEDFSMYTIMNAGWLQNMQKIAGLINHLKHDTTSS